jgi:hypothetical protein
MEWFKGSPIDESLIRETESVFGIKFPLDYIDCVLENNGGTPIPNSFDFPDRKGAVFVRLLSHKKDSPSNIVKVYNWCKRDLMDNIYPFAESAFGNYICFNYRDSQERPTIVFYEHEKPSRKTAISPICNTFTELIGKLYEIEDDDDLDW